MKAPVSQKLPGGVKKEDNDNYSVSLWELIRPLLAKKLVQVFGIWNLILAAWVIHLLEFPLPVLEPLLDALAGGK